MQIFIKNLNNGETIPCEVKSNDTIKDLIQTTLGFEQGVLMYGGKQLEEGVTLGEYGIEKDETLELGLEGGAFGEDGGIEEELVAVKEEGIEEEAEMVADLEAVAVGEDAELVVAGRLKADRSHR